MKVVMQIIAKDNGARTEPFEVELSELRESIGKDDLWKEHGDDYLLVLWQQEEEGVKLSTAPLITVSAFKELNKIEWSDDQEEVANG